MLKHFRIFFLILTLFSFEAMAAGETNDNGEGTLDEAFGKPTNLSDQEMENARTFKHEGYSQRKQDESCKTHKVDCTSNGAEGSGLMGALEQHMGKAYTMIFGGLSFLNGSGGPSVAAGKGADGKDKSSTDYCMYGAMGWEVLSMLIMTNQDENIAKETANIKDVQLRSLVALKKNHEARASGALMQSVAYYAVTACYGAYMAVGGATIDYKIIIKAGGAALIATLFLLKKLRHDEAAALIQLVIDDLPKAGDCNPWTGTPCFCAEKSSPTMYASEYMNICTLKLGPGEVANSQMGCGVMSQGKMTFDKGCACKKSNTCFNAKVKIFDPKFDLGNNMLSTANAGFDLLGSGEYDHAKLTNYSTANRSLALHALKKAKLPKVNLTPEQQKDADLYGQYLPPGLAAIAAASPVGNSPVGNKSNLDKTPPELKKKIAEAIKAKYNSGGGYGNKVKKDNTPRYQLPGMGVTEVAQNDTETLTFAQKAMENADVHNADTPIFEIISSRYQRSGWSRVDSPEMKAP